MDTSLKFMEHVAKFNLSVLPHAPYSLDLARTVFS
jgi:hypothetical protein